MTDVTGFGLLGHLVEMVRASAVDAVLNMERLPILPGALEIVPAGHFFVSATAEYPAAAGYPRGRAGSPAPALRSAVRPADRRRTPGQHPFRAGPGVHPGASRAGLSGRSPYRHSAGAERCA